LAEELNVSFVKIYLDKGGERIVIFAKPY